MSHTDLTPYYAFQVTRVRARAAGVSMGKMTSQTFYGYAKPGKNGAPAVIDSYRDASNGDKWMMRGDAFHEWLEAFLAGTARTRQTGDLDALLAEYAAPAE